MIKLIIPQRVWQKLKYYQEATTDEISGLGKIRHKGNRIIVEEVYLLPQENSAAHTTILEDGLSRFMEKHLEEMNELKLWWHSHQTIGCDFSMTDDLTSAQLSEADWYVSLLIHQDKKPQARLNMLKPFKVEKALEVKILTLPDIELKQKCFREVKKKVKQFKWYQGFLKNRKEKDDEFFKTDRYYPS